MILAMIARVSLGHTGRALRPSKAIVAGFALVLIAGGVRVLLVPFSGLGLGVSALFWCVAFGLFLLGYIGILLKPRL
ncbi:NnrS protein [compost metagenome]